jgi:hypothetical protein
VGVYRDAMKRGMVGGTHRGPVAPSRQRRTLRLVQILLVLIAAGLLLFAGFAWGRSSGYDLGRRSNELGAPSKPSLAEVIVPSLLGLGALAGALLLQGPEGIRMPTPARLDELAGRAERAAIDRAEEAAATNSGPVASKADIKDAPKP